MSITIAVETPLQDEVRRFISELNAYLTPLSPPEFQFQMTAEQMAEPHTTVFVARDERGKAVGMGALKRHPNGQGEVKRMYTLPEVRGQRVGKALLQAIEARAREFKIGHLVLETGDAPGFEPAWRLYERGGYTRCGVVLDYPDSRWSAFFEKRLDVPATEDLRT